MKKKIIHTVLLLALLAPAVLFAQNQDIDVTGVWKGDLYVDSTKQHIPYQISISDINGKLTGFSHIDFIADGKEQMGLMRLKVKQDGDQVSIEDDGFVTNTFTRVPPKAVKKIMQLTYTAHDSSFTIKGDWKTNHTDQRFKVATGTIDLQHENDYKSTAIYKTLDSLKLTNQLAFNEPKKIAPPVIAIVDTLKIIPEPVAEIIVPRLTLDNPSIIIPPIVEKQNRLTVMNVPRPKVTNKQVEELLAKAPPKPKPIIVASVVKKTAPIVVAPVRQAPPVVVKSAPPPPVAIAKPVIVEAPVAPVKIPETQFEPPALAKAAAIGADDRKTPTIQSIEYTSDSLIITLYDDGYIDGDTVSVLLDNKVFIANHRLTTDPNGKTIYINKDTPDSMMLVMYAENLGSIPPNTGLMVVHDGDKAYEVRFTTDLSTNAGVILRRKRDE
jgi:hypothetical protein